MADSNPGIRRREVPDVGVWHTVLEEYVGCNLKSHQGAEDWRQRMVTDADYLFNRADMDIHEKVDRTHWSAQPHEVIDPETGGCQHFRAKPHAVWFVKKHAHEDVKDRLIVQAITGACGNA